VADLSVAMIAFNEAAHLPRSLGSVCWADQLVLIDSSSTDTTAEVGSALGAEVETLPNHPNLNLNKNAAIDRCRCEWILVLDADEVVSDELAGEIRRVISHPNAVGYCLPRRNHVMGRALRFGSQYPDWQLRLFRRNKGRFPADHIHETIKIEGRVGRLENPLYHYPYVSVEALSRKGLRDAAFEARHLFSKGRRASLLKFYYQCSLKANLRFFRRYILKGGFLDGVPGLMMASFDAWNTVLRWLLLWEMEQVDNSMKPPSSQ